jgi:molecular chaperone HtpG
METKQGTLTIHSENIFPIIKKFLYSDEEVFLRELVSNAVDAIQKMKTLTEKGQTDEALTEPQVTISIDEANSVLKVSDNGIGMTAQEVEEYINQIAFSSAQAFIQQYEEEGEKNLIGHFGLGFYSAFMVADEVEIQTLSYQADAEPVHWRCKGDTEFQIDAGNRETRGTDVILHLNDEAKEYLETARVKQILDKYCKFLPVPVMFAGEQVNNTQPAWMKSPSELSDEDYKHFHQELYPGAEAPLFWIHLNVDYPFNLKGILFFPHIRPNMELQQNKIQLFQNQVYVTSEVGDIVPEYLTLLQGVIDSPDIPLNVSRSYLQTDAKVRKISQHIAKKVAQKLNELFKDDREGFEQKWDSIGVFVKYGMMRDDDFYGRAHDFALLKNTEGSYFTLAEYQEHIKEKQTDKNGHLVMLYANDKDEQATYIQAARHRGYDVLLFDSMIDINFVHFLESKLEQTDLKRVDSESVDKLIDSGLEKHSLLNEEEEKTIKELLENVIDNNLVGIHFETLDEQDMPLSITKPEHQRRMQDMTQYGMLGAASGQIPEMYNVIVNTAHPIWKRVMLTNDNKEQKEQAKHAYELALLAQNMLKGDQLSDFINRNVSMLSKSSG